MSPILPSACTYVVPRKKTCRHPCKLVTRKNKPQCRTKYLKKKKKPKGTKKKRTKSSTSTAATTSATTSTTTATPTSTTTATEESPAQAPAQVTAPDPLKSMVNSLSKRVSFFQKPV
uniref:Uncharacterized protein n=1 Tax=viral metagenome TaxID=1070528 RepID=A0A6C0HIU9_9ZZZZ